MKIFALILFVFIIAGCNSNKIEERTYELGYKQAYIDIAEQGFSLDIEEIDRRVEIVIKKDLK